MPDLVEIEDKVKSIVAEQMGVSKDEITRETMVAHGGQVVNKKVLEAMGTAQTA